MFGVQTAPRPTLRRHLMHAGVYVNIYRRWGRETNGGWNDRACGARGHSVVASGLFWTRSPQTVEFAPPPPLATAGRADGVSRLTNQMRRRPTTGHSSHPPRRAVGRPEGLGGFGHGVGVPKVGGGGGGTRDPLLRHAYLQGGCVSGEAAGGCCEAGAARWEGVSTVVVVIGTDIPCLPPFPHVKRCAHGLGLKNTVCCELWEHS